MKLKSFTAFLLLILMCFAVMSGCNSEESEESKASETATTQAQSDGAQEAESEPFNLLLIGVDNFIDQGSAEAVMLLTIDDAHGKIKLTSFNSDTYLTIPGYEQANLNNAYVLGQADLLRRTIEVNFGIDIHRYALANLFSFEDMVDALGGVEITLTPEEVVYINAQMNADGKEQIAQTSGAVKLSGGQALSYVKNQGDGAIESREGIRTAKQRAFIKALINEFTDASVEELTQAAAAVVPMLNTDLTGEEKSELIRKIRTYLLYEVVEASMPCQGSYQFAGGASDPRTYVTDWNMTKEALREFIYN